MKTSIFAALPSGQIDYFEIPESTFESYVAALSWIDNPVRRGAKITMVTEAAGGEVRDILNGMVEAANEEGQCRSSQPPSSPRRARKSKSRPQ